MGSGNGRVLPLAPAFFGFQDIEDSLARATDLIDQSKREVSRSRQIMKEFDAADDKAEEDRENATRS